MVGCGLCRDRINIKVGQSPQSQRRPQCAHGALTARPLRRQHTPALHRTTPPCTAPCARSQWHCVCLRCGSLPPLSLSLCFYSSRGARAPVGSERPFAAISLCVVLLVWQLPARDNWHVRVKYKFPRRTTQTSSQPPRSARGVARRDHGRLCRRPQCRRRRAECVVIACMSGWRARERESGGGGGGGGEAEGKPMMRVSVLWMRESV